VKFLADNVLLIGLAIGSGFMLLWPMLKRSASGVANLTPTEAVLLMNRSNAVVVDVREATEYAQGHIADAKHIPLAQLGERLKELTRYKDKPVLLHCQGGVRSAKACDLLAKQGFTKLYNLQGGINAWQQAKLPVVKD
jgi:rhodanese-related sulfurtransferase